MQSATAHSVIYETAISCHILKGVRNPLGSTAVESWPARIIFLEQNIELNFVHVCRSEEFEGSTSSLSINENATKLSEDGDESAPSSPQSKSPLSQVVEAVSIVTGTFRCQRKLRVS